MSGYAYVDSQKISEIIECPLCLEILTEPQIIPCSHSFCKKCLENLVKQKKISQPNAKEFSCPMCRGLFKEEDIISNPALSQLIFEVSKIITAAKDSANNGTLSETKLKQFLNTSANNQSHPNKTDKTKQKSHSKLTKNSSKRHSMINQPVENQEINMPPNALTNNPNTFSLESKLRLNCDNLHKVLHNTLPPQQAQHQKTNAPMIPPRKYAPFLVNHNSPVHINRTQLDHHYSGLIDPSMVHSMTPTNKNSPNNFMNLMNTNHFANKTSQMNPMMQVSTNNSVNTIPQGQMNSNNQQFYFYNPSIQQTPSTNQSHQASTNFPTLFSPLHDQQRPFY